jgi:hypothetical protein
MDYVTPEGREKLFKVIGGASKLLLIRPTFCMIPAYGQAVGAYQQIVIDGVGRPLAGVTGSVCSGLNTTGASIVSNVATLTFSSSPITAGFTVGSSISRKLARRPLIAEGHLTRRIAQRWRWAMDSRCSCDILRTR